MLAVDFFTGCVSPTSYEEVGKDRNELNKRECALASNAKLLRSTNESTEENEFGNREESYESL